MGSDASIPRRLFDLALPVVGLNVLNVLALAVDNVMVGWAPRSEIALAALGFAGHIAFLLLIAMIGLSVGTVAMISRAHGAGRIDRVEEVLSQSVRVTAAIAVVVTFATFALIGPLLSALGAEGEVHEAAMDYALPVIGGTIFFYQTVLFGSALRGVGNTQLPLRVGMLSNALNVVLNYGLILGNYGLPALGVEGAAYGTVVSQIVSAGILFVLLWRGHEPALPLRLRGRVDLHLVRELFGLGTPAALDTMVLNVALLSIIGMLGRAEEASVAAHGIGLRVQSLTFVPGLGISQATAALVGHRLGAADVAEAKGVFRASAFMCTGVMTSLGALVFVGAEWIVLVFGVHPGSELAELSVLWMRVLSIGMPLIGLHLSLVGLLQGSGATWISMKINLVSTALIQIPLSALLGFPLGLGAFGVWIAFPLSYLAKAGLAYAAYHGGSWAKVGLHA